MAPTVGRYALALTTLVIQGLFAASVVAAQEAVPLAGAYQTFIESTRAYRETIPAFQEAMTEAAILTDRFRPYDEADCMALEDARIVEEVNSGEIAKIEASDALGGRYELVFDRKHGGITVAIWRRPDQSSVSMCVTLPDGKLMEGVIKYPGGQAGIEIYFHHGDANTPKEAMTVQGGKWPYLVIQGPAVFWNDTGDVLLSADVESPTVLTEAYNQLYRQMAPSQLDALGIPWKARLEASPAIDGMDGELARRFAAIAGWGERFRGKSPTDLMVQLRSEEMVSHPHVDGIDYQIRGGGRDVWEFSYGHSEVLQRARRDSALGIYFDPDQGGALIGGRTSYPTAEGSAEPAPVFWFLSLYPEAIAPRIAMAATSRADALGPLSVWGPDGAVVYETVLEEPITVIQAVSRIDAALSTEQKTAINWQGRREAVFLTGEH